MFKDSFDFMRGKHRSHLKIVYTGVKVAVALNKKIPKKGFFVSAEGLEPSTNGLKGRCSAIELRARTSEAGFYHYTFGASIMF